MSGRTKWSALRDPMMADPQRRARIVARERAMEAIIELAKVREQRESSSRRASTSRTLCQGEWASDCDTPTMDAP